MCVCMCVRASDFGLLAHPLPCASPTPSNKQKNSLLAPAADLSSVSTLHETKKLCTSAAGCSLPPAVMSELEACDDEQCIALTCFLLSNASQALIGYSDKVRVPMVYVAAFHTFASTVVFSAFACDLRACVSCLCTHSHRECVLLWEFSAWPPISATHAAVRVSLCCFAPALPKPGANSFHVRMCVLACACVCLRV